MVTQGRDALSHQVRLAYVDVELVRAAPNDEPILDRLMQLYAYDFSEFIELDVGDDALYPLGDRIARCWTDAARHAFLCRVDGRIAGFVIVEECSHLTGATDVMDVVEFFVMRKYRRKGVGAELATRTFDLFPRKWEVRERATNTAATSFWRKTIDRYTGGRFRDTVMDDDRWHGPVQSFDATDRKR